MSGLVGLAEFDEPEAAPGPRPQQPSSSRGAASSTAPPPADQSLQDGGGVTVRADLEDAGYVPRIVNCRQCRSHMWLPEENEFDVLDPLCSECTQWAAILERRDTYIQANRMHRDPRGKR